MLAVGVMTRFLEDAPSDLPLITHLQLLVTAITRLRGQPDEALIGLRGLRSGLSGTDPAECLREEARAERDLGHRKEAAALYQAAMEAFGATGERWEVEATRAESDQNTE